MQAMKIEIRKQLSDRINKRNIAWFLFPTQLLIQKQWWSNSCTHLLQAKQCLDSGDWTTSQNGQRFSGSNLVSKSMNSPSAFFIRYPGSMIHDKMKLKAEHAANTLKQIFQYAPWMFGYKTVTKKRSIRARKNMKKHKYATDFFIYWMDYRSNKLLKQFSCLFRILTTLAFRVESGKNSTRSIGLLFRASLEWTLAPLNISFLMVDSF